MVGASDLLVRRPPAYWERMLDHSLYVSVEEMNNIKDLKTKGMGFSSSHRSQHVAFWRAGTGRCQKNRHDVTRRDQCAPFAMIFRFLPGDGKGGSFGPQRHATVRIKNRWTVDTRRWTPRYVVDNQIERRVNVKSDWVSTWGVLGATWVSTGWTVERVDTMAVGRISNGNGSQRIRTTQGGCPVCSRESTEVWSDPEGD